jgi:hypothetical protein
MMMITCPLSIVSGDGFHGIQDFHIPRTPAEIAAERPANPVSVRLRIMV